MKNKVLTAFATKYGSTAEIAGRIAGVIRQKGLSVDLMAADSVSDLTQYGAVILGSAVYIGRWRKSAVKFLESNEAELAGRDLWLFSSGPTGEGDPQKLGDGWRFPENLKRAAERVRPHDIALFHGAIDPGKLNFMVRGMLGKMGVPFGDYRDWDMIDSWAEALADVIRDREDGAACE